MGLNLFRVLWTKLKILMPDIKPHFPPKREGEGQDLELSETSGNIKGRGLLCSLSLVDRVRSISDPSPTLSVKTTFALDSCTTWMTFVLKS